MSRWIPMFGKRRIFGATDPAGQAMCANFRHQGGLSAVKRILAKTTKPYTLDSLYKACQSDTGNQVGAYRAGRKWCMNHFLKNSFRRREQISANDRSNQRTY